MIGKAKSIQHGAKGIDYALKRDDALILSKHGIIGDNGTEIKQEFRMFQEMNGRCKNNDISLVISPSVADGRKLSPYEMQAIAKEFMTEMNLDKHQYIAVLHQEKAHKHIHIYANRIDENGKAYKDNNIGRKAQSKADKVAQKFHLIRAKEVEESKKKALEKSNVLEVRKAIHKAHYEVIKGKPNTFLDYAQAMQNKGFAIKPTINNHGKLQGFRVKAGQMDFKASEVHRNMSLNKMLGTTNKALKTSANPKLSISNATIRASEKSLNIQSKSYGSRLTY